MTCWAQRVDAPGHPQQTLDKTERPEISRAFIVYAPSPGTREFVTTCRSFRVTPHVATKQRHSALGRRMRRHAGYAASQWVRKRVEEVFGWPRCAGGLTGTDRRHHPKTESSLPSAVAVTLLAASVLTGPPFVGAGTTSASPHPVGSKRPRLTLR